MSLRMITGLPGQGKTRFMVQKIYFVLTQTKRRIGTTCTEIEIEKFSAYLVKKHGHDFDIHRRIFFIRKQDAGEFYRYRGRDNLEEAPKFTTHDTERQKDLRLEAYFADVSSGGRLEGGVEYFITEAHRHFRSDTWGALQATVMFYLTQHRHFDDNLWIETQLPKQVVVQMRDLCEEEVQMANGEKQRLFKVFQRPAGFQASYYFKTRKNESDEVIYTEKFPLDPEGLASCYRTRGAVGKGVATPETRVLPKGLPFWTLPLGMVFGAAVVCAFLWSIPSLAMHVMGRFLDNSRKGAAVAMGGLVTTTPPQNASTVLTPGMPQSAAGFQPGAASTSVVPAGVESKQQEPLRALGYVRSKRGVILQLSDGSRVGNAGGLTTAFSFAGVSYPFLVKEPAKAKETRTVELPVPQGGATADPARSAGRRR